VVTPQPISSEPVLDADSARDPEAQRALPSRRRVRAPVPGSVDVAVIGSGLGGLTAAAYLARQGLKVAVFESHYVAGGCATQFRRRGADGIYHFDVGLHYIGDCGPSGRIPTILREVGIAIDYLPMDQDGFDTLIFPELRFRIPASVEVYRQRLLDLFPGERRGIDRYVGLLRAVMKLIRQNADSRPSVRMLMSLGLEALTLARTRGSTIAEFLDTCTRDPRLRAVMLGQSGDYGVPPSEASALLHLGLAGHYFLGAYYPKGGGQVIADRLVDAIEAHGGTVHLRHPVERVLMTGGRATGVRLEPRNGEPAVEVQARAVLSNADLIMTLERLVGREHLSSEWTGRLAGFRMADAIFITFLGVKADMRKKGMGATNYWQFDDYDVERFYQGMRTAAPDGSLASRGCYITSASLKDPENALHHAPAGVTNIEVMTVVPGAASRWGATPAEAEGWGYRKTERYLALKHSIEQQLVDRLEALFPGTAETIVFRESATPLSHIRYTRATDGTGYGLAATPGQFLQRRPGHRGPVGGLYLCGASTRAGHGILGAMSGGRGAARRIAAELGRPLHLDS